MEAAGRSLTRKLCSALSSTAVASGPVACYCTLHGRLSAMLLFVLFFSLRGFEELRPTVPPWKYVAYVVPEGFGVASASGVCLRLLSLDFRYRVCMSQILSCLCAHQFDCVRRIVVTFCALHGRKYRERNKKKKEEEEENVSVDTESPSPG